LHINGVTVGPFTTPLADAQVSDAITVGASGSVNDAAIPSGISRDTESPATGDISGSLSAGYAVAANAVALTTDTTGNYVASVATGTGLTGGAAGSEGAALTLSLSHLGIEALTDPNIDYIMYWDDSDGAMNWCSLYSLNFTISASDYVSFAFSAASGDISFSANQGGFALNGLVFEGATADTIETRILVTDPASTDKTITVPNQSGTMKVTTPIWLGAASATATTTGGALAAALDANDHWIISFGKDEYCFWSIPLPSDFDGSIESISFQWYMSSATEAVTWSLAVRTFADGGAMNTAYGAENSASADTAGAVDQEQRTSLTAASLLGSTANLRAEIRCKATTTAGSFTNEPKLLGVSMEY